MLHMIGPNILCTLSPVYSHRVHVPILHQGFGCDRIFTAFPRQWPQRQIASEGGAIHWSSTGAVLDPLLYSFWAAASQYASVLAAVLGVSECSSTSEPYIGLGADPSR